MPKISVISGAYNVGKCFAFEKSISSVLSQTFSDFEFIICDDGSSDNTWDLLSDYAKKDSRIKLLKNEKNIGLAATLNRCISESSGEFIARHDCDDYNDIRRFELQLKYFDENPDVSVLGTAIYLFDENGIFDTDIQPQSVSDKDFLFTSPYKHGSVMFRRDALMKANCYRVAKETRRNEDYDLFMRMQTFCKGANLSEPLYYFCEDRQAKARRKYRYRIDEAKVRFRGFKSLGLLPRGILYVIKPLIVGLIPQSLLDKMKKRRKDRSAK